jgi:hypothetical protein
MMVTVAVIVAAWLYGYFAAGTDTAPFAPNVLPGATTIDRSGNLFIGRDAAGDIVGYAATGSGSGYGGPLQVMVGVAPDGQILGVEIVDERESPGFFRLVTGSNLFDQYARATIDKPLQLGEDLDTITGATMSSEGVALSVRNAVQLLATEALNTTRPPERKQIQFGMPEIVLIGLFAAGYAGHKVRNPRAKRIVRWGTLITGMLTIGFLYTLPLTISMVVSLLAGYWPDWQSNLYWYLLVGGILFVTTVDAKNPYCSWFCPFGAFQECMAAVSKAKVFRPREWSDRLKWLQRGLALTAIVIGLALRNPGAAGYEPFATLFDFRGNAVQWALLIIVVLTSLMMYRPFCNYLCPLDPVVDFIAAGRRWLKETWASWRKPTPPVTKPEPSNQTSQSN